MKKDSYPLHADEPNSQTISAFRELDEGGGTTYSLAEFKNMTEIISEVVAKNREALCILAKR